MGVFARILVDVDLSEQLFEYVVVETEGHALFIDVQYEKQPLFCANCKVLGHILQNCMKLSSSNKPEAPAKFKTKPNWHGKKQASGTNNAPISLLDKQQAGTDLYNKKNAENVILTVDRHVHETLCWEYSV